MKNIDIDIAIDMGILENIDIDIAIDMYLLENIDIDIDKEISKNIDIDKAILQNINIDKILYRFEFGISNSTSSHTLKHSSRLIYEDA